MKTFSRNAGNLVVKKLKKPVKLFFLIGIICAIYGMWQATFTVHLSYHQQIPFYRSELAFKYLLSEFEPRAAILCPAGFVISRIKYQFTILRGQNSVQNGSPQGHVQDANEERSISHYHVIRLNSLAIEEMIRYQEFQQRKEKDSRHRNLNRQKLSTGMKGASAQENKLNVQNKIWAGANSSFGPCPTLVHCLGHQACLFHYSNKFCQNDPIYGSRKMLDVRSYCSRDGIYSNELDNYVQEAGQLATKPSDDTLHKIHLLEHYPLYTTFLKYNEVLDGTSPVLIPPTKYMIKEEDVFNVACPEAKSIHHAGYRGNCCPVERDPRHISDSLWTKLAREPSSECRKHMLEVYCAYMYNSHAECLPPYLLNHSEMDNSPSGIAWSEAAMPENGNRYNLSQYYKVLEHPHMRLIPARLAFLIMAHEGAQPIAQLLKQIYHPNNYYVIIFDVQSNSSRDEMKSIIVTDFPDAMNIRVMPYKRSFASSWGSYAIQRAQLECYEELLRMGLWDFAIYLSGRDLAIRSVEDLAIMLAPYRGSNIFRINGKLQEMHPSSLVVWQSCNRHVYNLTIRHPNKIELWSHSNFGIYSRDYLEYLVSGQRDFRVDRLQFYLQTSLIPDEMYLGTILLQSKFRNTAIDRGIHIMKEFVGQDLDNLCRHQEETDACGRGPPEFNPDDIQVILENRHDFFFSRKYGPNEVDKTRLEVINFTKNSSYYDEIRKYIPDCLQRKLAWRALNILAEKSDFLEDFVESINVTKTQVVPKLISEHPCCVFNNVLTEFRLILHFTVFTRNGESMSAVTNIELDPHSTHDCYDDGHIQAMYVTTRTARDKPEMDKEIITKDKMTVLANMPPQMKVAWEDEIKRYRSRQSKENSQELPLLIPLPTVVHPCGGNVLWIHFLLTTNVNENCRKRGTHLNSQRTGFITFELPPTSAPRALNAEERQKYNIKVVATVYDENGVVIYEAQHEVQKGFLGERHQHGHERIEKEGTNLRIELHNRVFEEGIYTVTLKKKGEDNSFVYRQTVILINETKASSYVTDKVLELFKITHVAWQQELNSDTFYANISMTNLTQHNALLDIPLYRRVMIQEKSVPLKESRKIFSKAKSCAAQSGTVHKTMFPLQFFFVVEFLFGTLWICFMLFLHKYRKKREIHKEEEMQYLELVSVKANCCCWSSIAVTYHIVVLVFFMSLWQKSSIYLVHDEN